MNVAPKGGKYCIEHHSKSDRAEFKKLTQKIDVKNGNEALLKAAQYGNINVVKKRRSHHEDH